MEIQLWELRDRRNMSLRDLEQASGVSKSEINAIENHKASPRVDTLELLAAGLEIDITELIEL